MNQRSDEERVDLSALDLTSDPERMEWLVQRILAASESELRARSRTLPPLFLIGEWARPVLAVAAAITVIALGVLEWQRGANGFVTVAEALEIGGPTFEWLTEEREPTQADLLALLEGGFEW
jgi:hypothetical protein